MDNHPDAACLQSNDLPTIQSVSLVVVCDESKSTDDRIWQVVRELGKAQCRAEVRLVDPSMQASGQRITYRPFPLVFPTVAEAIVDVKHKRVVVLDRGAELTQQQWSTLVSPSRETTQAIFQSDPPKNVLSRILVSFYSVFVLLFLKTRKHEFTRGAVILPADHAQKNANRLSGPPPHDVTRLMSLAAWNKDRRIESASHVSEIDSDSRAGQRVGGACQRAVRFWYAELMFPKRHAQVAKGKPKKSKRTLMSLLLMLIAGLLLFGNLNYPLFEPDETRNSELALALIESNDWSVLKLHQDHYWDKPPLQTWAIAASYQLFGPSPWATRFPIALASMFTVSCTFLLGKRLIGFYAAAAGAVMLLSSIGFVAISRYTNMDATLTAMTTATFLFGYESVRQGLRPSKMVLAGIATGLGLMVKGPIVLVLCGPPLLLAYWVEQNLVSGRAVGVVEDLKRSAWFVVPAAIVAGPWFAVTAYNYPGFVSQFFWKHNVVRFSEGFNHAEPSYYYLIGIFVFMFPASYLIPSAIRYATSMKKGHVNARSREVGFLVMAIGWIFLFFTLSSTKLPTYVLPAFPMICLLIGAMVEQWVLVAPARPRSLLRQLVRRAPFEMPAWAILFAVVGFVWLKISLVWLVCVVMLTVAGGCAVYASANHPELRRGQRLSWYAISGVALIFGFIAGQLYIPAIAEQRSDLAAIKKMKIESLRQSTIVFVGRDPHAAKQMLDRPVAHFDKNQLEEAANFLRERPRAVLVVSDDRVERLTEIAGESIDVEKLESGRHVYLSKAKSTAAVDVPVSRSARAAVERNYYY